jgi:hypothetical protein
MQNQKGQRIFWPNGARLAVSISMMFEGGGRNRLSRFCSAAKKELSQPAIPRPGRGADSQTMTAG